MPPSTHCSVLLLALALLAQDDPATAERPEQGPWIRLPPSAAADALAALPVDVAPVPLAGPGWPAWESAEWGEREPWERWSELVLEEAAAARPDAGRRARLALLAADQGRPLDAWTHFAAAARADPGVSAAILPRLFPGVPAGAPLEAGGRAGPLPDGVLLRPVLPPLDTDSPYGRPRIRGVEATSLAIGAAVVDVKLAVEADGVEVTFKHRSGGPARVRLVLPAPHDQEVRALYVDWELFEEPPPVLELELRPGEDSETAVWGRFLPRRLAWPAPGGPLALPATLRRGGFLFEIDPGDPLEPRLRRLAASLGALLGVPGAAALRGLDPFPARGAPAALTVGFGVELDAALREAKAAFLISAAERHVLRR